MSLLGATIGVNVAYLVELVGDDATLDRYSTNTDSIVVDKCNAAADRFRSAAIKGGYSSTDIDALTSSTIPESVRDHIGRIALDLVSASGMGRPDIIGQKAKEAQDFLSRLAGGAETIDGLTRGTSTGGPLVRYAAPDSLTFDGGSTTDITPLRWRDPEI